jgi:hypothetical protein
MANINKVTGFSPVRYLNGAKWNGAGNRYYIPSTDTNQYNIGDPVTMLAAGGDGLGIPGIVRATAGSVMLGVFMGGGTFQQGGGYFDPSNLDNIAGASGGGVVIPATKTKAYYAFVVDDPMVIFEIQEGGVGTLMTTANIWQNANFHYGAPASAGVTVLSGCYLDNNTVANTATLNCKILGLARRSDNVFGTYQKWNVLINNHVFKGGTGTAGV